ncbi:MAG: hypothetical protein JRN20_11160, partial [Nitrososphaerota archaeon]|nr:hypothetical protein [Nitrososphaerota archaeon]
MTLIDDLYEIHVTWLEGLGASYRIKGYFLVENAGSKLKIDFDGVAFGGNFGGHNINVQISDEAKSELTRTKKCKADEIEGLISEVQRRM